MEKENTPDSPFPVVLSYRWKKEQRILDPSLESAPVFFKLSLSRCSVETYLSLFCLMWQSF